MRKNLEFGNNISGGAGIRFSAWRFPILLLLLTGLAGCQAYNWRGDIDEFAPAEQQAREQGKSLFVYYKWWLDPDSNRMISEVLDSPEVTALFQDSVNLLVEMDYGSKYVDYMSKYEVNSYPASVIVAPDGTYKVRTGYVPKEEFIEFARKAKPSPATKPK